MLNNKPLIGISALLYEASRDYRITHSYAEVIAAAGGIPVLLPAALPSEDVEALLPGLDGLLIPGGLDVDPLVYGEEPRRELGPTKHSNDLFEVHLLKTARAARLPILCICRGEQILNVTFGGTLYQDLPTQLPESIRHQQTPTDRNDATHSLDLKPGSLLAAIYSRERMEVNSFHHQAIKDLAPGFMVTARAHDGVVEAIENQAERILGVQWHPEAMYLTHPEQRLLFQWLVSAAKR